jgi:hypothetical protein
MHLTPRILLDLSANLGPSCNHSSHNLISNTTSLQGRLERLCDADLVTA